MINVTIDYDSGRKKGIIITDYLSNIREHFSVEDKNQNFKRRFTVGYRPPARQYAITPQGRFEPRLVYTILEHLQSLEVPTKVEVTDKFREFMDSPHIRDEDKDIVELGMSLRDYQYETVKAALKSKSGVIILPTSAGKTFVMATLVRSIQQQQNNLKTLILVPDIQLVTQSYSDFIEYGIPEKEITKWTGSFEPDSNASIVIANIQILQSEKQDLSLLKDIKLLIIDECLRANSLIELQNNKTKPIQDIKIGDMIKTYNIKNKEIEFKPVLNIWKNLKKSNSFNIFLQIELFNGNVIQVTPNHKVYTQRGYIRADELTTKDEILSIKVSYLMNLQYKYMYAKENIKTYLRNMFKRRKILR